MTESSHYYTGYIAADGYAMPTQPQSPSIIDLTWAARMAEQNRKNEKRLREWRAK